MDVLVLEDAQEFRQVWCDFLEDEGHAVTAVDNAESAMAAMHEQPYDLLMLDLHLERGTSIGVSHYARTALPDCRIIIITGERVFCTWQPHCRNAGDGLAFTQTGFTS